ncbi:uncharacterized protein BCR38DRAFT_483893 [Pseudomassariella vexata]|uniref:Uncharacterized protein n=1 Tax=Pseudomassariella vexata TaxID=1141098 RepID=A0A1Y2E477_9PEZI|nr:uncharacterized protein BCR38DRAFT_483893 [Pseudomassariella vexata]ORY66247.1 hypothetical protein BCR38DRAFT_483893 [Pseudomassariella vexata]
MTGLLKCPPNLRRCINWDEWARRPYGGPVRFYMSSSATVNIFSHWSPLVSTFEFGRKVQPHLYHAVWKPLRPRGRKGSPHRRPTIEFPPSPDPNENLAHQAAIDVFRIPLSESVNKVRQEQRQISRSKRGVRVSRRVPAREPRIRGEPNQEDTRYSLMRVSGFPEHPYWGTLPSTKGSPSKTRPSDANEGRHTNKEHTPVRRRSSQATSSLNQVRTQVTLESHDRERRRHVSRIHGRDAKKRYGVSDPAAWDAISRTLAQQRRLSSLTIPEQVVQEALHPSDVPSRTSSQRRTLKRFTRQLEKYAHADGATGKFPVITPTESDSKVSIHTVKPLLPYLKEFQAAGLAVTSEEQAQRSPHRPRQPRSRRKPRTPKPPRTQEQFDINPDRQDNTSDLSTSSSSWSYIELNPQNGLSLMLIEELLPNKQRSERNKCLPWLRKRSPAQPNESPQRTGPKVEINTSHKDASPTRISRIPSVGRSNIFAVHHEHNDMARDGKFPGSKPHVINRRECNARHVHPSRKTSAVARAANDARLVQEPRNPSFRSERELGRASLPFPGTIEEDEGFVRRHVQQPQIKENLQRHIEQPVIEQISPGHIGQAQGGHGSPVYEISDVEAKPLPRLPQEPPKAAAHSISELPDTRKSSVSNTSSLELALNRVSQDTNKEEVEAGRDAICKEPVAHAASMTEASNGQRHQEQRPQTKQLDSGLENSVFAFLGPKSKPTGVRKAQQGLAMYTGARPTAPAKISAESPVKDSRPVVPQPMRQAPVIPMKDPRRTGSVSGKPPMPLEVALSDLDVFFDYDDGDINDKDVLKGLQIAARAAADETCDAIIRQRTGLRIRRFLADLKSIDEVKLDPSDQRARQRRAERRARSPNANARRRALRLKT